MPAEIKTLGVLAGQGSLPVQLVSHCLDHNISVCVVQFEGCTYQEFPNIPILKTRIEKVGKIFDFFKKNNVDDVVMIGDLKKLLIQDSEKPFSGILKTNRGGAEFWTVPI